MPHIVTFIGLIVLLFGGAWGWGLVLLAVLRRLGWSSVHTEIAAPLQIALGVSLFLAVGGVLVAASVARLPELIAWHVIGMAVLVAYGVWRRRALHLPPLRSLYVVAIGSALGAVVGLMSLGYSIGFPHFNQNDDDPAYIYLAQRLLNTGGMIDPFNLRRVTQYGGSTLYQAMFLGSTGNASLRGYELTFGILLLLVLTVRTVTRRWVLLGSFIMGAGLILGHGVGPFINLGPTFSAAALSLAVYQLLRTVRVESGRQRDLRYVVVGVLTAGVLALRFYYLIPVAVAIVLVLAVMFGRRCRRPIGLVVATGTVCTFGWAVAMYRSSGTPLFPLFPGNYDTSGLGGSEPGLSLGTLVHRFGPSFAGDYVGYVALAAVVIAAGHLIFRRTRSVGMLVLLSAGVGCLVEILVFTYSLRASNLLGITRFVAPSTLACGCLFIDTLWPIQSVRRPRHTSVAAGTEASPRPRLRRWRTLPAAVLAGVLPVLLILGTAALLFNGSPGSYPSRGAKLVRRGWDVLDSSTGFANRYQPYQKEYAQLSQAIPPGASVFVALERPALLPFSRFRFATLDGAGSVSPAPHLPYFTGTQTKVQYLRHLGFRYIAAESPGDLGLYNLNQIVYGSLRDGAFFDQAQAAYYIDWDGFVRALEMDPHYSVRQFGTLLLIRI